MLNFRIGQFEVAIGPGLYVCMPYIGALFVGGGMPLACDSWRTIKAAEIAWLQQQQQHEV